MKPIIIKVTQKDIDSGVRISCGKCPIALAIIRTINIKTVRVGWSSTLWTTEKGALKATMPSQARHFITAFDNRLSVEPFQFELAPEENR